MKKLLLAAVFASMLSGSAQAMTIGVAMGEFDDNWLTILRNGMIDHAKTLSDVTLQVESADRNLDKQLSQLNNFVANKVDAIIVNPVDTDATVPMSELATKAGIPLIFVNRQPVNVESLPARQAYVGSNDLDSGTLQTKQVCHLLEAAGKGSGANIYVMEGELSNQAARQRTQDIHDVIATPECNFIKIIDEQTAHWLRDPAQSLMANWLTTGTSFDAVIANNDEMAIGAIQAMRAGGIDTKNGVIVAGIDATQDALAAMKAGDLKVTVFQDAVGQGKGAVNTAVSLVKGERVESKVWVPFLLVTQENMDQFANKN